MKDGMRTAEHVEVSRQEVYEDYVNYYLQRCTDERLCRDEDLLKKAARYLQREPEPRGTFTVFPFDQALFECCGAGNCRKLSAFVKAVEILETICVNLFLQPWKKEIKTLKTFTGPFVYCLLPVFSRSTIQSVLASIGYLPHAEAPQSEYRLSEDANPDRAVLVGFELLLARVECYHLQELLDKEQLAPQDWLKVLQRRRGGATKLEQATEKKTTFGQKEEEEEKKKEEAEGKKEPRYVDSRFTVNPQPKPQHCPLTEDQSIMEMQNTYPDLVFRGRPLLQSKPHRAHSSRSSCKATHTASTNNYSNDIKAAELPTRDCNVAATTSIRGKAAEVFGDDSRSPGCNDRNSVWTTQTSAAAGTSALSFADTDRSRVDDKLSHDLPASLHITLKAGSTSGQRLKPGEPQPPAEPPAWTQALAAADQQNKSPDSPGLSSLTNEQQLRQLAESMGHLHVHETKEGGRGKGENKRAQENTNKERRRKERKTSSEREAEEQNLRRPVMETGPVLSHASSRCTRASQCEPAVMREQKQPMGSPLTADSRVSEV